MVVMAVFGDARVLVISVVIAVDVFVVFQSLSSQSSKASLPVVVAIVDMVVVGGTPDSELH